MRAKIFDVSWWQFAEKDADGNTVLDYDNIDFEAARADGFDGVIDYLHKGIAIYLFYGL